MGVNILTQTSPASGGALVDTGTAFVLGPIGSGPTTAPAECHNISDFETAFSTRTGAATAAWDWLDTFFSEGGNRALVLDYATAGQYANALALLTPDLGPGQVAVVGETLTVDADYTALYTAIQTHVDAHNRIGLLDVALADNSATLLEAKGTLAQALTSKENIGLFGSWVDVPAPRGVIGGSARQVPASAVIAALCNRVDQNIGSNGIANYNQPAGGRDLPLKYATGFVFDPKLTSDQTALKAAGCNFFHDAWGVLENYAFLTPLYTGTPLTSTPFGQLNASRARMWLKAQAAIIGESYYMKDIDGELKLASQLGADLDSLCNKLFVAGGLFGDSPSDAYNIQVGVTVNTTADAATGTLNAVAECRFSQYADTVNVTLVSVPVAGSVS